MKKPIYNPTEALGRHTAVTPSWLAPAGLRLVWMENRGRVTAGPTGRNAP